MTQQNNPVSTEDIELALAEARDLKRWWAEVEVGKQTPEWFELVPEYPGAAATRGFFATVRVMGRDVPMMGHTGDYFFDLPAKDAPGEWVNDQVREFALKYWLRAQNWAVPLQYPRLNRLEPNSGLMGLSMMPRTAPRKGGLGNCLRAYRLRASGETGEFPPCEGGALIHLGELAEAYRWILVERNFLEFDLDVAVGGNNSLTLRIPAGLEGAMAISPDLVIDRADGEGDFVGEFGMAAAWTGTAAGLLRTLHGTVRPALSMQSLRVMKSGEIRLRVTTILARPSTAADMVTQISEQVSEMARQLSGGMTAQLEAMALRLLKATPGSELRHDLEKKLLLADATAVRDALLGTRITWLGTADWRDTAAIPDWMTGEAAAA